MKLQPGDLFCTRNPMALGRAINAIQAAVSRDGKSTYSHSGIIVDSKGTTFEAISICKRQNLFEAYAGDQIVVARWSGMTPEIFAKVFKALAEEHEGKRYPFWRLPLNIVPAIGRHTTFKGRCVVCSELVAKFLYLVFADFGHVSPGGYCWPRHKWFTGTSPDILSDEWHRWREYKIIFEGILKGE